MNRCVFSLTSSSSLPVRASSTAGSKRNRTSAAARPTTEIRAPQPHPCAARSAPAPTSSMPESRKNRRTRLPRSSCCGPREFRPFRRPQHFQDRARRTVFLDRPISRAAAVAVDQRIHAPIRDRPHQKMQRMTVQRLRERREFPRAHVPGKKKHALAAPPRRIEILESVQQDDPLDILPRVFRKLRKLARHPPNLPDHPARCFPALRLAPIGKCQIQIEHRRAPQRRANRISGCGKTRSGPTAPPASAAVPAISVPVHAAAYSSHSRIASHYAGGRMSTPEAERISNFTNARTISAAVLD